MRTLDFMVERNQDFNRAQANGNQLDDVLRKICEQTFKRFEPSPRVWRRIENQLSVRKKKEVAYHTFQSDGTPFSNFANNP